MHPADENPYPQPHPDCKAPHANPNEYIGPTHACAGKDCPAREHAKPNATGGHAKTYGPRHHQGDGCFDTKTIPDSELYPYRAGGVS